MEADENDADDGPEQAENANPPQASSQQAKNVEMNAAGEDPAEIDSPE